MLSSIYTVLKWYLPAFCGLFFHIKPQLVYCRTAVIDLRKLLISK